MGNGHGFFNRLQYRLAVFMQGRYGPDQVYRAMLVLYAVLLLGHVLTRWFGLVIAEWVLLGVILWRCFSRNIPARQRENALWLRFCGRCREKVRLLRCRFRDRRTHVYRTCPHCRAVVRLPRTRKGSRVCNCPRCRRDFSVRIR